ncbi:hypothetical protein B0H17DRAFT_569125 [Mycena rosella]|uniref:Uncharacterized protein n=1 Tax=Mycena rosella TaxID=1033263 RepID=A0AAD7GW93_MYCRO|nr:hypothetical protein B0H17DRAFT_569125 [Mycena rosella]
MPSAAHFEFSYDFPVASTSALPAASARSRSPRSSPRSQTTRLPRPRWEAPSVDDDADDAEIDYDAFGYPARARPAAPLTPTRNQWRAPSPSSSNVYPYSDPYAYTSQAYRPPSPIALASSCESERSALSSCPSHARSQSHSPPHKIRKARPRAPSVSSLDESFDSHDVDYAPPSAEFADEEEEEEEAEAERGRPATKCTATSLALRRQWAALSLRVRFGVFRAKRRMRDRVLSL